ncbi:MAG: glycoside hydrolase family 2 protein [Phycisphaerae bacterium]|nr:glycoside hydrolase family 2 protein [Phycisphaerae bacterium]
MSKVSLNGAWQMRQDGGKGRVRQWVDARVPGCVHTDLLRAGKIPDPYYRRNELDVLWVDQAPWEYVRRFRATASQARAAMQHLVFEGLDTAATVYLNGRKVGTADNMFRRWRFDVAGRLREGENVVRVVFESPIAYGRRMSKRSTSVCNRLEERAWADRPPRPTFRPFVRKAQCHFGWDWGPLLATSGIWQDCYVLATDEPVLDYVTTQQSHGARGVRLDVTAHVLAPKAGRGTLAVRIDGQTVLAPASLKKGANRVAAKAVIAKPKLWWPAGAGKQPLYDLDVSWTPQDRAKASDRYETQIGLRKVELVREKDAIGRSFKFRINGRDIYCKGANWIPDDVFADRTTPDRLRQLVEDAVAANMNMLRLWGGGIYAQEELLRLCDRHGIMVWHDLMFACAAYPEDKWFLDNVEAEVRHQLRRMSNHPSIVLWCGNNENQTAVDSWWSQDPNQKRFRRAYDKLTYDTQQRVVGEEDPGRPWVPSSPTGCPRKPGYAHGDPNVGDMHYWIVWHGRKDFDNYLTVKPRFSSEFGFQSFPSIDTLRTVARPEDMNVSSPVMEHHQRNMQGNSIIVDFMTRYLRLPSDMDGFCYLSQLNQGLAMKTAIEHWRRVKPHCMGTLYWQLNDIWPVASWSSIDWLLRWKALHYMARRFHAPLLASVSNDTEGLRLWATSDLGESVRGSWSAEARTYDGRRVWSGKGAFALKADQSRAVAALPREKIIEALGGTAGGFVRVALKAGSHRSENDHHFAPLKRAELPKPRIVAQVAQRGDALTVTLKSDATALFVELSTGKLLGTFSDNILTLLPGKEVTVTFRGRRPTDAAALRKALKVRSLRDTY